MVYLAAEYQFAQVPCDLAVAPLPPNTSSLKLLTQELFIFVSDKGHSGLLPAEPRTKLTASDKEKPFNSQGEGGIIVYRNHRSGNA